MYRWQTMSIIAEQRAIGIVRTDDAKSALTAGQQLLAAGMRTVEIALTTPGGLDAVQALAETAPPGTAIGAGTVLDATTARLAILAGATFLVSPSLDRDMIATAHRYDTAVVPGTGTATEVVAAMEAGADAVKYFPSSSVGPGQLRDLRGPLPQVPFIPTGGITVEDAPKYIAAGAVAVGVGSALTVGTDDEIAARVQGLLQELARAAA